MDSDRWRADQDRLRADLRAELSKQDERLRAVELITSQFTGRQIHVDYRFDRLEEQVRSVGGYVTKVVVAAFSLIVIAGLARLALEALLP